MSIHVYYHGRASIFPSALLLMSLMFGNLIRHHHCLHHFPIHFLIHFFNAARVHNTEYLAQCSSMHHMQLTREDAAFSLALHMRTWLLADINRCIFLRYVFEIFPPAPPPPLSCLNSSLNSSSGRFSPTLAVPLLDSTASCVSSPSADPLLLQFHPAPVMGCPIRTCQGAASWLWR